MRLRNIDLLLSSTFALLNVVFVAFFHETPIIGTILAIPLVFILPGYAIGETLFYKRSFDGVYRFTFSIGISLIVDIFGGFLLNLFPTGLRSLPWVVYLGLLVVIFSLVALYLRRRFSINMFHLPILHLTLQEYLLIGVAISIVFLSIQYSAFTMQKQPYPGFTQLWLLPVTNRGHICAMQVGIKSFETGQTKYHITVQENGLQTNTWSSISLVPQREWKQVITIASTISSNIFIEIKLYTTNHPENVYREVHVTTKKDKYCY